MVCFRQEFVRHAFPRVGPVQVLVHVDTLRVASWRLRCCPNFHWTAKTLEELAGLHEMGTLRPVVDREYSLDQVVLAHRYVEQGHKRGNVVLRLRSEAA